MCIFTEVTNEYSSYVTLLDNFPHCPYRICTQYTVYSTDFTAVAANAG